LPQQRELWLRTTEAHTESFRDATLLILLIRERYSSPEITVVLYGVQLSRYLRTIRLNYSLPSL